MAYEKRVAVLKQVGKGFSSDGSVLTGAVYAERLGKDLTLKIQAAGLAALKDGRYVVVFSAEGKRYCLDLGKGESIHVSDAPSLKEGFCVLLAFVKDAVYPVAFGVSGKPQDTAVSLMKLLMEQGEKKGDMPPVPVPPVEIPPVGPNVPRAPVVPVPDFPQKEGQDDGAPFRERACAYNDEAIADADYFAESVQKSDRNEDSAGKSQKKRGKTSGGENSQKDDLSVNPFLRTKGKLTYYKKVRRDLEEAFRKFPKDTRLLSVFPRSEWVKTDHALLGIVYENGQPRYLCVAAEKNGAPPDDMKENCVFVPESPFTEERGFYIVFQDADSGAYVKTADA